MLKIATSEDSIHIEKFLKNGIIPLRINSYINAYGFDKDFVKYWVSINNDKVDCIIALFEESLLIYSEGESDISEIKAFISMLQFSTISCEKETAEKLGFKNYTEKQGYIYSETAEFFLSENIEEENIKCAYKLICENIPDSFSDTNDAYLSFLSDYTYRNRRNLARGKCIIDDGKLVSCAFTSAETKIEALLSGVVTDKDIRKGGYGKRTVLSLVYELNKSGKTAYVIALNDSAKSFYEHIGFKRDKTIAYIKRKDI